MKKEISIGVKEFNIKEGNFPLIAISINSENEVSVIKSKTFMDIIKSNPKEAMKINNEIPDMLNEIVDSLRT